MKKILQYSIFAAAGLVSVSSYAETTDYYWHGGTTWEESLIRLANPTNWATDSAATEFHTVAPSATSNLYFDYANMATFARVNQYASSTTYPVVNQVNSLTATVALEMHMTTSLTVLGDWKSTVSSDTKYNPTSISTGGKSIRLVADSANFLAVNGDMILETEKYFNSRLRLGSMTSSPTSQNFTVGGALSFIKSGTNAVGYHAFDMLASDTSTGTTLNLNLGGLKSSGQGVFMTSGKNATANFTFADNASGVFKGGNFEGVFATESSVSSTANFTMNGNGKQSITIYKAANAINNGFESDLAAKTDMTIDKILVTAGELVFKSELAANSLVIDSGSIEYVSAEKVSAFTINGGSLVYGGEIKVGDFTVAAVDIVKVILSADDFTDGTATIVSYDYIDIPVDANDIFAAYDAAGNKLGGTFSVTNMIGAGSLLYTVPEPATLAAIFGAVALAFAAYRRRR